LDRGRGVLVNVMAVPLHLKHLVLHKARTAGQWFTQIEDPHNTFLVLPMNTNMGIIAEMPMQLFSHDVTGPNPPLAPDVDRGRFMVPVFNLEVHHFTDGVAPNSDISCDS
jgi:hypothetical protein